MSAVFREGVTAFEENNFEEAGKLFELAVTGEPEDPKIRVWLATTYQKLGRRTEAIKLFQELTTTSDPVLRRVAEKGLLACNAGVASAPVAPPIAPPPQSFATAPPPMFNGEAVSGRNMRPEDYIPAPAPPRSRSLVDAPTRPKGVGDIISAGVTYYRARFAEFTKLGLIGFGLYVLVYLGVCILSAIPSGILLYVLGGSAALQGNFAEGVLGVVLASIVFGVGVIAGLVLGLKEFLLRIGQIQRVVFADIIQQESDASEVSAYVKRKSWTLVWSSFFAGGILLLPFTVQAILLLILAFALGVNNGGMEALATISFAAFGLGLVGLIATIYLGIRCSLSTSVLAVEDIGINASIRRSWELTQGNFWHTFGVTFLQFLLVGVGGTLLQYILLIPLTLIFGATDPTNAGGYLIVQVFSLFFSLAVTALTLPFGATTYTVLYYDLRARKEGLDLMQQLGG